MTQIPTSKSHAHTRHGFQSWYRALELIWILHKSRRTHNPIRALAVNFQKERDSKGIESSNRFVWLQTRVSAFQQGKSAREHWANSLTCLPGRGVGGGEEGNLEEKSSAAPTCLFPRDSPPKYVKTTHAMQDTRTLVISTYLTTHLADTHTRKIRRYNTCCTIAAQTVAAKACRCDPRSSFRAAISRQHHGTAPRA